MKHIRKFNESNESQDGLSEAIKYEIKICFENTVMCARTNSPQESYEYAERMANYVIQLIEKNKK